MAQKDGHNVAVGPTILKPNYNMRTYAAAQLTEYNLGLVSL